MAFENQRVAWVNRSSTQIPVYGSLVKSSGHVGGLTPGGTQVGSIYKNEFYTLIPQPSTIQSPNYLTWFEIIFRNGSGVERKGYIETQPNGVSNPLAGWVSSQEPYHYFNSNGSSLVSSATESIGGTTYRIFTVKKAVTYRNSAGTSQGTLAVGTKLATNQSTTGQTYGGYMYFAKKKVGSGSWQNLTSGGYGFVDLGLSKGSEPSTRAIW